MNKQRILAHDKSKKLSEAELADISAAGTSHGTLNVTHGGPNGNDVEADVEFDM